MSVQRVWKWCRQFADGRTKDEERSGCQSISDAFVNGIDGMVRENRCVTLKKQLEMHLNLSHGTVWDIVHESFAFRKVCSWFRVSSQNKSYDCVHLFLGPLIQYLHHLATVTASTIRFAGQ